jgi:hypothetical protein
MSGERQKAYGIAFSDEHFEENVNYALDKFADINWATSYVTVDMRSKEHRPEPLDTHLIIIGTPPDYQKDPEVINIAVHVTMLGGYTIRAAAS